jgi:hypothetical protein
MGKISMGSSAAALRWGGGVSTPAVIVFQDLSKFVDEPESDTTKSNLTLGDAITEYQEDKVIERQASAGEAAFAFKELLYAVEGVEAVMATKSIDGVSMICIVNNVPRAQRREIHDLEWMLMQQYLGTGFDFRIVDLRGRPLCDVISVETADAYLRI